MVGFGRGMVIASEPSSRLQKGERGGTESTSSSERERLMTPGTSEGDVEGEGRGLLYDGEEGREEYEMEERRAGGRIRRRKASFQLYTPDEEAAVVRKLDRRLVVFVAGLYMLSFLDRSSICPPPPPFPGEA